MGASLQTRSAVRGLRERSKQSVQEVTRAIGPCSTLDRGLQEDDEGGELVQERAGLNYMSEALNSVIIT